MDTDVLIVGAGPTGLMLANQLARRGVRIRIIDRHAGPARETRALGVHARTLEIYAALGIADRAIELGKRATGANMWARGRRMARIPLGDAGLAMTPYPYVLVLGQDDNEALLGERLGSQGVTVEWNTELVALDARSDAVTATLRGPHGEAQSSASWLAGCDGARSAVRTSCGIPFEGAPYEHVFFVADVEAAGTMVADEVNVYLWRSGFHLFFPMRGRDHWRLVGILPAALRNHGDVTFASVMPSLREEAGSSLEIRSCSWFSTYRIHHRAASRFRSGRAFLLGDAAHIHSPVGAQGMNTGLQDAYNLAWKLALVVGRVAEESILDSYDAERMPVARRLLETTDRAFKLVVSDHPLAGLLRTEVLARAAAFAMSREVVQRAAFRIVSQVGIRYAGSPLSRSLGGLASGAPAAGDRFPWLHVRFSEHGAIEDLYARLDDTLFNLIVVGQSAPPAAMIGPLVRVHAVADDAANRTELARAGVPLPSFYLLRPDGHVGLCGTELDLDAIAAYAAEVLRVAPGAIVAVRSRAVRAVTDAS